MSDLLDRWTALADPGSLPTEIDPGLFMPPFVHESEREPLRVAARSPQLIGFNPPPCLRGAGWANPLPVEDDYAYALAPTDVAPILAGLTDPLLNPDDRHSLPDGQQPDVAAHVLHEWGATAVEELTCAAIGAAHHDDVSRVSVSVDQRLLVSTAKVLAARVLLANVGSEAQLLAVTSGYRQTAYAAHNNRTRGTLGALAAFLGGADLLAVRPHTWATGSVAIRDVRDALNVGRVLRDEALLGRVEAPAAGARWVARAARLLADAAWTRCRDLDADAKAYARDAFDRAQAQHADRLGAERLATIGVTHTPNPSDTLAAEPLAPGRATGYRLTGAAESRRFTESHADAAV